MEPEANCEVAHFHIEVEGKKYLNSSEYIDYCNTIPLYINKDKATSYGEILDACVIHGKLTDYIDPTTVTSLTLYLPEREPEQNISVDTESYEGER